MGSAHSRALPNLLLKPITFKSKSMKKTIISMLLLATPVVLLAQLKVI